MKLHVDDQLEGQARTSVGDGRERPRVSYLDIGATLENRLAVSQMVKHRVMI